MMIISKIGRNRKAAVFCSMRTGIIYFFSFLLLIAISLLILFVTVYVKHVNRNSIRPYIQQKLEVVQLNSAALISELEGSLNHTLLSQSLQEELFQNEHSTLQRGRTYSNALLDILLQNSNIISAAVFENSGTVHIEKSTEEQYIIDKTALFGNHWQEVMKAANGDFVYDLNGGGVMKAVNEDQQMISLIRELQRLTDYTPFGYVVFNLTQKQMERELFYTVTEEDSSLVVCTPDGEVIASSGRAVDQEELRACLTEEEFYIQKMKGQDMAWSKAPVGFSDWLVVCRNPVNISENIFGYIVLFAAVIGILLIALVYIGQIFMADLISRPLEKLVTHMQLVRSVELSGIMADKQGRYSEIHNLYEIYNQMLRSIRELIHQVEEESAIKRKREIALLQEQIKPHFLYNALDAVSALSLIGDHHTAYQLTQALGGFYRTSLSSGQELVSVATEIECIRNYATILNIRYKDKLKMMFDIPTELVDYRILRLILQPLVENAVNHGIRHCKEVGQIKIKVRLVAADMILSIQDNGVGMSNEKILAILRGETRTGKRGFGISSLIEKLCLFYRTQEPVKIESQPGKGTRIAITIPAIKG